MTKRPTGPKEPSILASTALVIRPLADVPVPTWALEVRPHAWWLRDRLAIDLVLGAQGHRSRAIVCMALISYYSDDESITPAESRMIDEWAKSLSSDQIEMIADIGASIADELVDLVDRLHGYNHHPMPDEDTWQKIALDLCHGRDDLEAIRYLLQSRNPTIEKKTDLDNECTIVDKWVDRYGLVEKLREAPISPRRKELKLEPAWWLLEM